MLHGGCKMKLRSVDSIRSTKDIRNQGLSEFIDEDGKRIQPTEAQHRLAPRQVSIENVLSMPVAQV